MDLWKIQRDERKHKIWGNVRKRSISISLTSSIQVTIDYHRVELLSIRSKVYWISFLAHFFKEETLSETFQKSRSIATIGSFFLLHVVLDDNGSSVSNSKKVTCPCLPWQSTRQLCFSTLEKNELFFANKKVNNGRRVEFPKRTTFFYEDLRGEAQKSPSMKHS